MKLIEYKVLRKSGSRTTLFAIPTWHRSLLVPSVNAILILQPHLANPYGRSPSAPFQNQFTCEPYLSKNVSALAIKLEIKCNNTRGTTSSPGIFTAPGFCSYYDWETTKLKLMFARDFNITINKREQNLIFCISCHYNRSTKQFVSTPVI